MSDLNRREPDRPVSGRAEPSEDYGDLGERRNRRIRIVAWATIIALILTGGGATVLTLLFG